MEEDDPEISVIDEVIKCQNVMGWGNEQDPPEGWINNTSCSTKRGPKGKGNKKFILASFLPTIFVTNHRSFFPKFHNFLDAMKMVGLTLGLHSEIWEVKEKKAHQIMIEEAFELEGVQYISNSRPNRRGGVAAISLMAGRLTLSKLEVYPKKSRGCLGFSETSATVPRVQGNNCV